MHSTNQIWVYIYSSSVFLLLLGSINLISVWENLINVFFFFSQTLKGKYQGCILHTVWYIFFIIYLFTSKIKIKFSPKIPFSFLKVHMLIFHFSSKFHCRISSIHPSLENTEMKENKQKNNKNILFILANKFYSHKTLFLSRFIIKRWI